MISFDLGSNTLQCVEYECTTQQWGGWMEKIVRTADGLHESGRISEAAQKRIIDAILEAKERFCPKEEEIVAVTTAAMRMASNSDEVLDTIEACTGVRFEIIDAQSEARFTRLAVSNRLRLLGQPSDEFVLIDIGGGSSEVVISINGQHFSRSFPVGIVTTAQACERTDEIPAYLQTQLTDVKAFAEQLYHVHGKPKTLAATAGTPTTMAAYLNGMTYATYDPERINGYRLSLDSCGEVMQALLQMSDDERSTYVGVGREDLIVAGIVIVELFYRLLGFDEVVVINDGVREGAALDYCQNR